MRDVEAAIRAIAERHRREIVRLVRDRELTAGQIASHFEVSRPAVSQHLRILKDSGLVTERRQGTRRYYRARVEGLAELATQEGVVDLLIPRGGEGLKTAIKAVATVPVMYAAAGNCHVYVHQDADLEMAERVAYNAKVQRPGVCNAAETLLVHRDVAEEVLPGLLAKLSEAGVELVGDQRTRDSAGPVAVGEASDADWDTEYHGLKMAVGVVDSLGEAIDIARNDMGEFLLPAQRPGRPWGLLVQVAEVQASYGDWPGFPGPPNRKPDPSPVTRIRRRWHDSGPLSALENGIEIIKAYLGSGSIRRAG